MNLGAASSLPVTSLQRLERVKYDAAVDLVGVDDCASITIEGCVEDGGEEGPHRS